MDGTGTLKQLGYTVALTPMNPTGLFHVRVDDGVLTSVLLDRIGSVIATSAKDAAPHARGRNPLVREADQLHLAHIDGAPVRHRPSLKGGRDRDEAALHLGQLQGCLGVGCERPRVAYDLRFSCTVMLVAGIALPFTIVSTAAASGSGGFIAARGWGDGATSDVTGAAVGRKAKIVNGSAMEAAAGGTAGTASTRAFRNGHMRLGRAGAVSPGLEGTATINDGTEAVAGGRAEATSG